ncbi:MAG: hypothetical protein MRY21_02790 [Simkaniaceae bacterium]|nr:hypothetical protein [Simkaniaceae bacterium]
MQGHKFLFTSGSWIGEGKITMNALEEELSFFTRWRSHHPDPDFIEFESTQEIQIAGHSDIMNNEYFFSDFVKGRFEVELENQAWGKVYGEGIIDENFIGWEFRGNDVGFEGYEYYQLQEDGSYRVKAEFSTGEDFHTTISGKIWKQLATTSSS